ncbi:MAG: DUF11 domain-containing protein, partial [Leucobacter sp.]|nr:DUF11 domain-containing protein [Leucobacter sp.]
MTVTKSTTSTTFNKAGDILNYTVVVKNTGNVTLEDVTVEDSLVTLTNAMRTESISPDGKLEVGETWTYEYTYTVTQADMDKGSVSNAAKAYNPDIPDDPDVPTDDVTITGEQNPAMTVEKSADKTEFSELNEVIIYTVKVTNTGNISLKGVVFSDSLANISTPSKTESNAPEDNILQVGEVWTYTYNYKVTQADLDAGKVENTASVKTAEITTPVTDSHTVKGTKLPKMTVNKSVDKDKFTAVGEELKYTVVVTNTGNITLENVTVTDSLVTLTNAMRTESMTDDGKLEVGETWTYKYTYKTTQADMDAGTVTNSAKASNPYIPDDPNNPPPADDNEIPGIQNPAMTVTKNANKTEFTLVGEVITYNVVVENTGNITLKEVKVEDSLVDLSTVTPAESKLQDGKLEVGETWTYYYSYTTTQEDMDAGYVKNSAKATNPNIPDGPDAPADKKDIPGIQNPDMEVRKSADKDKFKEIGEKINYTVVITNTGNIT